MDHLNYKISSRTTILLGRESISKVETAIVELIKNSYDADATVCILIFDIEHDRIFLLDNGSGMTLDTIDNYWMLIGTDNKKDSFISNRKRIKVGEKGIGRFSLDRLGADFEMITKHEDSPYVIKLRTDWNAFEEQGKTLNDMRAEFESIKSTFLDALPTCISQLTPCLNDALFSKTGTLFIINNLRDNWSSTNIDLVKDSLTTLLPPSETSSFLIYFFKSLENSFDVISNEILLDYDYSVKAIFNGDNFKIDILRHEYNVDSIPDELLNNLSLINKYYTKKYLDNNSFTLNYSIQELLSNSDSQIESLVKEIGNFEFTFKYLKLVLNHIDQSQYFYKNIGNKRKLWMNLFGGIRIYRDGFFIRPYGIPNTDTYDWLGLDSRRATNPASISHPSGSWHVRNSQCQGSIFISRIGNPNLRDITSREGLVDNEHFKIFKEIILSIISVFEKDKVTISREIKKYNDIINKKENIINVGKDISIEVNDKKIKYPDSEKDNKIDTLSKAVKFLFEDKKDLISEIKLLRALATNGLITSTLIHDLKTISANLGTRVNDLKYLIKTNAPSVFRYLQNFENDDLFLKTWINVVQNIKKDRRTRSFQNVIKIAKNIVHTLEPVLSRKKISINITGIDDFKIKLFYTDFESIFYNLIINSIEAFENQTNINRTIDIYFSKTLTDFTIEYKDNGPGISSVFKNKNDIFNFGVSSKKDKDGNIIGTGLGMYIVSSTLREYNADFMIVDCNIGFKFNILFKIF